jgi:hypothetical protein
MTDGKPSVANRRACHDDVPDGSRLRRPRAKNLPFLGQNLPDVRQNLPSLCPFERLTKVSDFVSLDLPRQIA